jgi:hypothetical protein
MYFKMKSTIELSVNPYQFQKLSKRSETHSHIAQVENNFVLVVLGEGLGDLPSKLKRIIYQKTHSIDGIILNNPVEIPWSLIKSKLEKKSPAEVIREMGLENILNILSLEKSLKQSH